MFIESSYIAYLVISIAVTIWVAHTLSKNGRVFLIECFQDNERLADSINHMLVVGFYLINIGYVTLALKANVELVSVADVIEFLSKKVGLVLLVLGAMHFFNMYVIAKWGKRAALALRS